MIERDALPAADEPRRAVPQGRHCHTLLPSGQLCLEQLLPGILAELVAAGAPTYRAMRELCCVAGGHRAGARRHRASGRAGQPALSRGPRAQAARRAAQRRAGGPLRRGRPARRPAARPDRRRAAAAPRGGQRRRGAARRPGRGRHRPRRATARLAGGARLSRAPPSSAWTSTSSTPPVRCGCPPARWAPTSSCSSSRGPSCRAACSCSPRSTTAGGSAPTGTAATTRRPTPTAFTTSSPRSPRRTSRRRSAPPSRSTRSWRTASPPTCAAATSACAGFPAGCCRSATRSARSTRSTGRG